ncbi:vesicular integral-membrane protein VIP36 isoform X1 [Ctenocephalides felis]|uniref:vesicular integral-membrane protein VIP36 isoform X1 n=1 Tax=Ctenocephalides felis TaxID=7515 RepID=UPI000E6E471F|nr:vesicular integral-membrane protein VIP36 isoform X1 [Ctenocephalides felis]
MLIFEFLLFLWSISWTNFVAAQWNTNDYMKREHSLVKPYQSSGMAIPYWEFMGSTMVTTNYVRITPDQQSKTGAIWNSVPCQTRNWELQIQFHVHGKGKDLFGDGMAIWYAEQKMIPGPVFGNMDFFRGLAVILDTYSNHNGAHNHQHPYISAMVNNGTLHYDHDRDGTHTQLAGCEARFRNSNHDSYIRIRYENDVLGVATDMEGKNAWKDCFSVEGVKLPTGYHFGVSATTGDLSDNHDVLSFKLYELDPPDAKDQEDRSKIMPSALLFEPPRDHTEDPKPSSLSGLKIFLLMLVGAIALIVCVVLGIMFYQKHKENSRKRFY